MMGYSYFGKDDYFYRRCIGWRLKFTFFPKYCDLSGKKIWLKLGYEGYAMFIGSGDIVFEHRWHDKHEHIIWKLKK
jgi:hypothetical protein